MLRRFCHSRVARWYPSMTTAPRIKWARKAISILRKRKSTTVYVAKPKCRVNRGSARMVATLGPTLPDPIAPPRLCRVRYSALYVTARAPQNEIQQQGDQSGDKWYRLLQVIKERRLKTCITFDATGFSRESRFIRTTGFQIVRPTDRMDGFYYDVPNRARKISSECHHSHDSGRVSQKNGDFYFRFVQFFWRPDHKQSRSDYCHRRCGGALQRC
ncbi:uncharacterized protein LOC129580883 isoform X8 [Paramacrobiotus metropolitanus]|uniref:uncharacterized protein LOC129580883 isoform X8 n=1 Tax=Paramacrobiotus metropolitanus TaxID=2943436 RepID=UPI002445DCDF|nr:uncharacterized protein LOC129580883 isoform X8 [Paramacrobiotus metropolitanus]